MFRLLRLSFIGFVIDGFNNYGPETENLIVEEFTDILKETLVHLIYITVLGVIYSGPVVRWSVTDYLPVILNVFIVHG